MKQIRKFIWTWTVVSFCLGFSQLNAAPYTDNCGKLARLIRFRVSQLSKGVKRYPNHIDSQLNPNWNLQYGFESEYGLKEISGLLKVYAPTTDLIAETLWASMSLEERQNWVGTHLQQLFPQTRSSSKLIKKNSDSLFAFLPNSLILDDTQNVEIVLPPMETLEEWFAKVTLINEHFGIGSMQSTVSLPADSFFGRLEGERIPSAVAENLGYFKFYHDLDTIRKLDGGYERYTKDPTKPVAQFFNHVFVGPMSQLRHDMLEEFLRNNAYDRRYSEADRIEVLDKYSSFKYIGGTVYRPDLVGPLRTIFEIRDANKNFAVLAERVLRTTYHFQFGRLPFFQTYTLKAFNSVEDFQKLTPHLQEMLKKVFPVNAARLAEVQSSNYPEKLKQVDTLALETFRNYAWPLRDWSMHIKQFGPQNDLAAKIESAQQHYVKRLQEIHTQLQNNQIDTQAAALKLQGALSEFAHNCGIFRAMDDWQHKFAFNPENWNELIRRATILAGPFMEAFPASIWAGQITSRAKALKQKWPEQVALLDDVIFSFKSEGQVISQKKHQVLIISLKDLSTKLEKQLLRDYLKAVSFNTVSFPLSESAGHLYTRLGFKVFDWYSWGFRLDNYLAPNSKRLEAVVNLTPEEQFRFRTYVENVQHDSNKVIGSAHYDGVGSGTTTGQLDKNLPALGEEGHNCTSWICTSPIGNLGETLMSLVGTNPEAQVHINPGWWSMYLSGKAPESRVPLIVYWNKFESLDAMLEKVRPNSEFINWDFNPH